MNELLARIVEAHGELHHWKRFNRVEATTVTGGAFWGMKNLTQDQNPRRMTVSLHEEHASVSPFGDPDWHTEFTPDRIAILRGDSSVVAERHDPRTSFAAHEMTTPWDPLHRAHFNGFVRWTYLTTPFLLTMAGVQVTSAPNTGAQAQLGVSDRRLRGQVLDKSANLPVVAPQDKTSVREPGHLVQWHALPQPTLVGTRCGNTRPTGAVACQSLTYGRGQLGCLDRQQRLRRSPCSRSSGGCSTRRDFRRAGSAVLRGPRSRRLVGSTYFPTWQSLPRTPPFP
jgi:hypothetical protein